MSGSIPKINPRAPVKAELIDHNLSGDRKAQTVSVNTDGLGNGCSGETCSEGSTPSRGAMTDHDRIEMLRLIGDIREQERAAIVAYLRARANHKGPFWSWLFLRVVATFIPIITMRRVVIIAADAIEAGSHIQKTEG